MSSSTTSAAIARQLDANVRRIRIDVDHRQAVSDHRPQAVTKMFTLLATDNHDAQMVSWLSLLREGPLDDAGRNADGG